MAKKKDVRKSKDTKKKDVNASAASQRRSESGKFVFPVAPQPISEFLRARPRLIRRRVPGKPASVAGEISVADVEQICDLLEDLTNDLITKKCAEKEFSVESLFQPCKTQSASGQATPLDLVVVIDTSGSMAAEAADLSNAAQAAIDAARKRCVADLQVTWLGIEGTFPGTNFDTTVRDHLHGLGITDAQIKGRKVGDIGESAKEDGGAAIEDISLFFNWRAVAQRAILFLGDESLKGGTPQDDEDKQAADDAIATANSQNVQVSTYAGSGIETIPPSSSGVTAIDEYERVALATTGGFYSVAAGGVGEFQTVLEDVICRSSSGSCLEVRVPEIRPCFTFHWGDGPNDRIETDDVEVVCLTASNPYTNVTLKDFTAYVFIVDSNGNPPATLPDGTLSVEIHPSFLICFGDLDPCGDTEGRSEASRDLVLISRGAAAGPYFVLVGYCYSAEFHLAHGSIFPLELVAS